MLRLFIIRIVWIVNKSTQMYYWQHTPVDKSWPFFAHARDKVCIWIDRLFENNKYSLLINISLILRTHLFELIIHWL